MMVLLEVNLASGWSTLWGSVSQAWAGLSSTLTVIGVILVLFAVVDWIWQKRRGGGSSQAVIWTLVTGAILAGPTVVIPLILILTDFLINTLVNLMAALFK